MTTFELQSHLDAHYASTPRRFALRAQSRTEFETWRHALRAELLSILGIADRLPHGTPPSERIYAVPRAGYTEEKYSLNIDGIPAPTYVLVPDSPPPYKPIMVFHGHNPSVHYILGNYQNQEEAETYLARDVNFAQALAQAGYLVCAIEQRGFGERVTQLMRRPEFQDACRHLSFEYLMMGRTMAGERIRDAMAAMNFILARDDIVPGVLGATGCSGGGMTALWLAALDDRITVTVPACYFCSFKASVLSLWHCECNYIPGLMNLIEMGELGALLAPRPVRMIAGEQDHIFPIDATREQFKTVIRAYHICDAEDTCSLAIHPGGHAYHHGLSHEWFDNWL